MLSTVLYTRGERSQRDLLSDTAVIILHWGNPEVTRLTLERLRRVYQVQGEPFVILVENGPPLVPAEEFSVETLRLPRNLGYGAANNAGIRAAMDVGAKFVVLLNNDVGVSGGLFEAMRDAARRPGVGLVGAVLQEADGPVYGGGRVSWLTLQTTLAHRPVPEQRLHYIHGACLGITRECLQATGMLREDFFLYWEDVDLGLRARRTGFRFAVVAHPALPHHASLSLGMGSPAKTYYLVRNALHLVEAHGSLPARLWSRLLLPWRQRLAEHRGKVHVLRALQDAVLGIKGPAPDGI